MVCLPGPASLTRTPAVTVHVTGPVSADERDSAQSMVTAVVGRFQRAAGPARMRVTAAACAGGPGLLRVICLCGASARVQVPGRTVASAIGVAAARLARQLGRLTTAWEPWPWPDPQRRALATPGEGRIARLKTVRLYAGTVCQAAAIMSAMDYDEYLYTDSETGEDAVVYRAGPRGLTLARQRTMRPPTLPSLLPLTVNPRKTPILTASQAATRLADGWLPFVFYTDPDTRRGNLLYRRYDGDLGLIAPAAGSDPSLPVTVVNGTAPRCPGTTLFGAR